MGNPDTWTPEKVQELVALNNSLKPYYEMAAALQVSVNAIAGKIYRLGIKRGREHLKGVPKVRNPSQPRIRSMKPKKRTRVRLPADFDLQDYIDNVLILYTEDSPEFPIPREIPSRGRCKYIHGDPKSGHAFYCGKATHNTTSWCKKHYKKVIQVLN